MSDNNTNYTKDVFDYIKFVTGLSTGSIVTVVAFMKQVPEEAKGYLIVIAIIGFMVSVLFASVFYTMILLYVNEKPEVFLAICLFLTWVGFIVGLFCLSAMAIKFFL